MADDPDFNVREWIAISCLIGILIAVIVITQLSSVRGVSVSDQECAEKGDIEVIIKGAVAYQGVYRIPYQTPMQVALKAAQPLPQADLRRFKKDKSLMRGNVIHIPERQMVRVTVEGAVVSPGEILVPKGTRVADLENYIALTEQADKKVLQKKRFLKDREIVHIPMKTKETLHE